MKNIIFTLFVTLIAFVDTIKAQSNPKISIQGILREASGVAVEDGEYDLVFRIYEDIDASISAKIYEEEHPGVTVANGIYSVHLGTYISMGYLSFDKPYFVGVQVGSTELKPRIELTHSPYSMAARSVSCSGAVGDIKYSILDWDDFQIANGDCWIPMDGRTIAGTTALAQEFEFTEVPDMSGLFIRAQEWNDGNDPGRTPNSNVATMQNDEFKEHDHDASTGGNHTHTMNSSGGHSHAMGTGSGPSGQGSSSNQSIIHGLGSSAGGGPSTSSSGSHSHTLQSSGNHTHVISLEGGAETRSKNMNFYIYIRIN